MWTPRWVNVNEACRQPVVGGHRCCRVHGIRGQSTNGQTRFNGPNNLARDGPNLASTPVTSEAHPYPHRLRPVRGRRTQIKYIIGLTGLAEAFCHSWYQSKKFEMADRRDWGGGGDDPEESTQRMKERIWESLTDIRARMDQQAPVPLVAVPPGDGETVPIALIPPGVEVLFTAPVPPPPPVLLAEEPVMQGHIKADVLAPSLSECERLSPADWTKLYPLSAQQLGDLNASQASSNQPPLSPGEFLDANSLHLIRDSYLTWVERYKERQALPVIRRFASLLSSGYYLPITPQN
ncbi:hypothetical protein Taro_054373 [Colocasia esculenta]|uniref:Uncharacterized protein n=1 Tax=Colocasia esculenta TaxID=4460 RepID=A0A843XNI5_COLES|nr:hypothetical protein [Colocasia esculenta]